MKIEKLPSGSYRLRKTKAGKQYTVIVDYKPSLREAEKLMSDKINNVIVESDMTFSEALESYINLKRNVLSPSVIREYTGIPNRLSEGFVNLPINRISQLDVQKEINLLAKRLKPKTVKNYHGVISIILKTFRPELTLHTTLPQKEDTEMYIPSDEDVKALIHFSEGTPYEAAIKLACYGLRRSEICCITSDDITDTKYGPLLSINKAVVSDANGKWVTKTTKTVSSNRDIYIDENLAELIRKQGKAFIYAPNALTDFVVKACSKLNLTPFHLHSLRHFFVSTLADKGISDENIIRLSGHSTDYVMKRVYRHAKNVEQAKKEAASTISDVLFN